MKQGTERKQLFAIFDGKHKSKAYQHDALKQLTRYTADKLL